MIKTINIPTKDGTPLTATGKIALLYVGQYQQRFLLQETQHSGTYLTHFASGKKIGDLNRIKLQDFRSYQRMTDREAARRLIDQLVVKFGADFINQQLNDAPVINE